MEHGTDLGVFHPPVPIETPGKRELRGSVVLSARVTRQILAGNIH